MGKDRDPTLAFYAPKTGALVPLEWAVLFSIPPHLTTLPEMLEYCREERQTKRQLITLQIEIADESDHGRRRSKSKD